MTSRNHTNCYHFTNFQSTCNQNTKRKTTKNKKCKRYLNKKEYKANIKKFISTARTMKGKLKWHNVTDFNKFDFKTFTNQFLKIQNQPEVYHQVLLLQNLFKCLLSNHVSGIIFIETNCYFKQQSKLDKNCYRKQELHWYSVNHESQ